jgi:predicted PhzF superfamily epimerase YddE/YHI9
MVAEQSLLHSFVSVDGIASRLQHCGGNPCLLQAFDAPPRGAPKALSDTAQCQSWPDSRSEEPLIAVRCYSTAGDLIQCCGHGLLAAAHHWQRRLQRRTVNLSMNGSRIASWCEGDITWLRFNGMRTAHCAVPEWLQQVFSAAAPVQAAATGGDAHGYLVLQWPDGFNLQQLSRPGEVLSAFTERALICTSAQPEWGEGFIQLRYFAPQYGVDEDAATGSAMRVLAQYWSPRFQALTAYQCSPSGGLLKSRHTAACVEVGGRCSVTTAGDYD